MTRPLPKVSMCRQSCEAKPRIARGQLHARELTLDTGSGRTGRGSRGVVCRWFTLARCCSPVPEGASVARLPVLWQDASSVCLSVGAISVDLDPDTTSRSEGSLCFGLLLPRLHLPLERTPACPLTCQSPCNPVGRPDLSSSSPVLPLHLRRTTL